MSGSLLRVWLVVTGVVAGASVAAEGAIPPLVAAAGAAVGVVLSAVRRGSAAMLVALALFGFGCGAFAASTRATEGIALETEAARVPHCDVEGRVLEQAGGLGTLVSLEVVTCGVQRPGLLRAGVAVMDTSAPAGSSFRGSGWLLPLGGDRFDRARRRAGARAEFDPDSLSLAPPTGVFMIAASVRDGLRRSAREISPPAAALIRGLTIGDTEALTPQTLDEFRRAGLSHLLAVSGSNVAIVLAAAALLTRVLTFRVRLALGAAALALFLVVVGPDPSVLRAVSMGAVALIALGLGRSAEPLHALGVAVAVLVVARPQVVFSVGLHLSVAATAGIILWAPRVLSKIPRLPPLVALPLSVTLAAQVGVVPVLAGVFGELSVVAPAANLAAAAAVPPATILGLAGGVVGTLDERAGGVLLAAAEPFARWVLLVARISSEPQWAALEVRAWVGVALAAPVCVAVAVTLRRYGQPVPSDDGRGSLDLARRVRRGDESDRNLLHPGGSRGVDV